MHGLTRVRGMTQDDSHSYVTPRAGAGRDQAPAATSCLGLLRDFGLDDFYLELSTRDDEAGQVHRLRRGVGGRHRRCSRRSRAASGLELVADPGGAAFYGPKISVQARDAIGRTWQMSTIQYDFNQPARFELEYQAADGTRQQPVMIHSAKFGSIERFFGVLTEHYAGAFPPWLAPVQVVGIPVADDLRRPPRRRRERSCEAQGIRVEVDDSDDRMQKKIRTAQKQKVPFMLIAGDEDVEAGAVSFRYRDGTPGQRRAGRRGGRADRRGGRARGSRSDGPSWTERSGRPRRRGAGRLRAALDAAPDGLHRRRGQAGDDGDGGRSARSAGAGASDDDEARWSWPAGGRRSRCSTCTRTTRVTCWCARTGTSPTTPTSTDDETVEVAALTQHRDAGASARSAAPHGFNLGHEPGRRGRRRHRRAPAPARGAALGRRRELPAGRGAHQGAAAAARRHPAAARGRLAAAVDAARGARVRRCGGGRPACRRPA